jgi:uncharacterized RDD family membrane protein YckC
MSDPNVSPPPPEGEPPWAPPAAAPGEPTPTDVPGGSGPTFPTEPPLAPPLPPPGQYGAPGPVPPPPGQYGAPGVPGPTPPLGSPGAWDVPPPNQTWGVPGQPPPPPGGFQMPAQPYQYGAGAPQYGTLATPGKRILGRVIDWLIILVVLVPLYILVIAAGSTSSNSTEFGASDGLALGGFFLFMAVAMLGPALYEIAFTAIKGATPGKMLVKVRVVREQDGQIPGWGPAFMRWVPSLVNLVPCLGSFLIIGLWIWALVNLFNNEKRQTPFDLAAKTVVVDTSA